jgi:hypothetical protein
MKRRDSAASNALYDIVRGVKKYLNSDGTGSEYEPASGGVTAFNSDGFTIVEQGGVQINASSASMVAWAWDAGTTTATNTVGSISSQVRANASAGFSVCTFTQPSSSGSFSWGHGLNVAPELVFMKPTSATGNWQVYHKSTGSQYLWLNSTNAATGTGWSTVNSSIVTATATLWAGNYATVAYCWAPLTGYSSFGSYTGNGSADGPFVYTGFRPRWVMFKSSSSGTDWIIEDAARSTYNVVDARLFPNASEVELSNGNGNIDYCSNGFKLRNSHFSMNSSGATYIYAAFAESPFQYARAR